MKLFCFFIILSFFTLIFTSCSTENEDIECYVAADCPTGFECNAETFLCYELNEITDVDNSEIPDTNEPDTTVNDLDNTIPDKDETPLPMCGDGNKDVNEECDDGNNISGDGCDADCKKEESPDETPDNNHDEDIDTVPDDNIDIDNIPDVDESVDVDMNIDDSETPTDEDIESNDAETSNDSDVILTCENTSLSCGLNAHCDDSSGTPTCICDADYQDQDGNGNCNPTCDASGIDCNEPYGGTCFINSSGYAQCQCKTGYTSSYCNVCDYGYVRGDSLCDDQCFDDTCVNATDGICGWLNCSYFNCEDNFISGASCTD